MPPKTLAELSELQIGDSATSCKLVTEQDVDTFSKLSSDDNALHMNEVFAKERGFPGRVAHGMIAMAMISKLIGTQLPGHGSLWMAQDTEFTEPVMIGDELEARVTVDKISLAARVVQLQTEVLEIRDGRTILRGTAKVRVP